MRPLRQIKLRCMELTVVTILGLGMLANWLQRSDQQIDLTANQRHSLSEATQQLLSKLDTPLEVIAYLPPDPLRARALRGLIARYRQHKTDIYLRIHDASEQPSVADPSRVGSGEVILRAAGKQQRLQIMTEDSIAEALAKLTSPPQTTIAFSVGRGERRLDGDGRRDLGLLGFRLQKLGFELTPFDARRTADLPAHPLLIVADPQAALETQALRHWLEKGGSLLWLGEPGQNSAALQQLLGIRFSEHAARDPRPDRKFRLPDNTYIAIEQFPAHPSTAELDDAVLLAGAASLQFTFTEHGYRGQPILGLAVPALSTPHVLGLALSKTREDGTQQRIAILGDSDFASNAYLGNAGNRKFATDLLRWLLNGALSIDLGRQPAADLEFKLDRHHSALWGFGSLMLIPSACLVIALTLWWRQRRS